MNNRFNFRIWDDIKNEYKFSDSRDITFSFNYRNPNLEQCLGIKDKKHNLVYENDIVRYRGKLYAIMYATNSCRFYFVDIKTYILQDCSLYKLLNSEVVENINNTMGKELKS